MSINTTKALHCSPSSSTPITLTFASAWVFTAWSEIIASASDDLVIAGISIGPGGAYSGLQVELDIAIGMAGSETSLGSLIRIYGPNSGSPVLSTYLVKVPIPGISVGDRISIRGRGVGGATIPFTLLYYTDFDKDTLPNLTAAPLGDYAVAITPNAIAWANSDWEVVFSGIDHEISLAALIPSNSSDNVDVEFDVGVGAPGSEEVITTLRSTINARDLGALWYIDFPGLFPLVANSIVSVRMRKNGTDAAHIWSVAIQYYDDTLFLTSPAVGSGIYFLNIGKTDDTLFDNITSGLIYTTRRVKIP